MCEAITTTAVVNRSGESEQAIAMGKNSKADFYLFMIIPQHDFHNPRSEQQ
jgi:hypothetical protein